MITGGKKHRVTTKTNSVFTKYKTHQTRSVLSSQDILSRTDERCFRFGVRDSETEDPDSVQEGRVTFVEK